MAKKVTKKKKTSKVTSIRSKKPTPRIDSQEALFRDSMELKFGIKDQEFLARLYHMTMQYSSMVTRLAEEYQVPLCEQIQFVKLETETAKKET